MRRMILCLFALAFASPAFADPTGPELLGKVDHALNCFKDAVFESKLLVKEGNGQREYDFTTSQKGQKRRVRFTAPGDIKGMGVLVENESTMYVFLPGFQRIRRMGTHVKNQTFMGSDFAQDDISQTNFGSVYDAKVVGQEGNNWVAELTAKKGQDLEFPKLKLWVDKTMFQPTKIEFYDGSGKKLKTQERLDYHKDSPEHWQPGRIVVTDHRRNNHQSEIVFTSSKIDPGLSDDLFSVRQLARGN